jgi:RNA polymerase sigma factor (sigma-70 family)
LFARHKDAANRLASTLTRGNESDDLVSDAFNKVLNVLLNGGGPDIAFRAYLLTAVRRLHIDQVRSQSRTTPTDDLTPFDSGTEFADPAILEFEGGAAAKAFASLPERWQLVLWHLEVENQKPAEIAPLLGMSANSVSALAYRAREGLRQAFLNEHAQETSEKTCKEIQPLLGAHVRGALSKRDSAKVEDHMDGCRKCTATYLELADVNKSIGAVIAPVVLGSAAIGYLATASGNIALGAGIAGAIGRAKDAVVGNAAASAVAAVTTVVVAGVAVAGTIAVTRNDDKAPVVSTQPVPTKVIGKSSAGDLQPEVPVESTEPEVSEDPVPLDDLPIPVSIPEPEPIADVAGPRPSQPSTKPSPAPDPKPVDPPAPTPIPTPTPTPTPPPPPPPPPSPTPPPLPEADASVQVEALELILGAGYRVMVNGVPTDASATVEISVVGANLDYFNLVPFTSGPCKGSGSHFTCTAGPGTTRFHFTRSGLATGSLQAVITSVDFTDTNPANDSAAITIN